MAKSQVLRWIRPALNQTLCLVALAALGSVSEAAKSSEKKSVNSLFEKDTDSTSPKKTKEKSNASLLAKQASCESLPQKTNEDLWEIANCFRQSREYAQAVASLREVVRRNPQDLDAYFVSSWLLWEESQKFVGEPAKEASKMREALTELQKARLSNPSHWQVDVELGDFQYLRLKSPESAYAEYLLARKNYNGDYARNVSAASQGRKASIENRIARTAQALGRKGESVEASCRALFFDPDDPEAQKRIKDLGGSCDRKGVTNPNKKASN